MKVSQRFAEATAYADNAYAAALGVSPSLVGFAMLNIELDNGFTGTGNRQIPLWTIEPVDPVKVAPLFAADRAASVETLAAKYATDPMGVGDSPYEHEFHPFELCAGIATATRNMGEPLPEFIVKLGESLLTK